jgi:hypothetical protein
MTQLLNLIDVDSGLDSFCSIILFVSLLRVIQVPCARIVVASGRSELTDGLHTLCSVRRCIRASRC